MVRLNLGSGDTPGVEGTVNIDIVAGKNVDKVWDLTMPLPYPDNSVDEVYSHHLIEHLEDPVKSLKDWFRVLVPGGKCEINTPSMDGIVREWPTANYEYKKHLIKMALGNSGGYMRHQCLFWPDEIEKTLEEVGFINISVTEVSQCGGPGMCVICYKP